MQLQVIFSPEGCVKLVINLVPRAFSLAWRRGGKRRSKRDQNTSLKSRDHAFGFSLG